MSIVLEESLEAIAASIADARRALQDEHEGDVRRAVQEMFREAASIYELVHTW